MITVWQKASRHDSSATGGNHE